MAQLRDARTSSLIAEGTPNELVTIADELGLTAGVVGTGETAGALDAIYDDVGLAFDPDAIRQARDENLDNLRTASTPEVTPDDELRESIEASYTAAVAEIDQARERAPQVQDALDQARARVT